MVRGSCIGCTAGAAVGICAFGPLAAVPGGIAGGAIGGAVGGPIGAIVGIAVGIVGAVAASGTTTAVIASKGMRRSAKPAARKHQLMAPLRHMEVDMQPSAPTDATPSAPTGAALVAGSIDATPSAPTDAALVAGSTSDCVLSIRVPENTQAGQRMVVVVPDGRQVMFTLPPGHGIAGTSLELIYDSSDGSLSPVI